MEKQMKWKDQMLIQIRFVVVEHIRIVEFRENQQAINGHFFCFMWRSKFKQNFSFFFSSIILMLTYFFLFHNSRIEIQRNRKWHSYFLAH